MLRSVLAIIMLFLIVPGCGGKKAVVMEPEINMYDLIGHWRGSLPAYYVNNGATAPSYSLQNLDCTLILNQDNYWFQLGSYSDSLDFSFVSKGYWLLFEGTPQELYFQVREEWSNQMFKGLDSLNMPVVLDTISARKGDGSEPVGEWSCLFDLGENEIRIYDFIGYESLGEEIFLSSD